MRAVVFGAGNIGRGFLGQLLSQSGYATTFIDVRPEIVAALNDRKEYPVTVVGETVSTETVRRVQAIHAQNDKAIKQAIAEAEIVLTAVGSAQLSAVAKILAQSLHDRLIHRPHELLRIMVVACENVTDNTTLLKNLVATHLPESMRRRVETECGFPRCVVDRIVPNLPLGQETPDDNLAVCVEEYFQFMVDGTALNMPAPSISGMQVVNNLGAMLQQKLLTLNMAHAVTAYFGYFRNHRYIHEAIADEPIHRLVMGAMEEAGEIVCKLHPTINQAQQQLYAKATLKRFANHYLQDAVTRVARDPLRKLGPEERLVFPAAQAAAAGITPAFLASGIAAALQYDYEGDPQAKQLTGDIRKHGLQLVLKEVSRVPDNDPLGRMVEADYLLREL